MVASPGNARDIFIAAVKLNPDQRDGFLKQACGDDDTLYQRVLQLLKAHQQANSFLEPAQISENTIQLPPPVLIGTQIGPYKLLQQIGEGGMGVVFMAEQNQPVQRKVALKIIKPGMDSKQVIARFEAERQALAMMDHVNIARVIDGGTTESGLPFFVMELVHGVPITRYCDDNHLTPKERLELFVPVCQAIQHAHQKGIIHRDVKPSNVLVTLYDGKPVPKVIDFGIAKAIDQKLTDRTLFTNFGAMVGTLEYMSPEQAEINNLGVDTRSDIYSLGVLLYELLTGSTPLTRKRLKEAANLEILRMIKEEEPQKPSTRLSESGEALASISAQRKMEPAKLTKFVRGELDWIVLKALEKDRNRRYETANGFAVDLQRYLANEAVSACPPSAGYRVRKFVQRNRGAVITTALVIISLVLGSAISVWQMIEANNARQMAEVNHQRAVERYELAHEAVTEMYSEFADKWLEYAPELEELQKQFLNKALTFYERFTDETTQTPSKLRDLGIAYYRIGRIQNKLGQEGKAEGAYQQALLVFQKLVNLFPSEREYRSYLGDTFFELGRRTAQNDDDANSYLQRAIALRESLAMEFPAVAEYRHKQIIALSMQAGQLLKAGRSIEADNLYSKIIPMYRELLEQNPHEYKYQSTLAGMLHNQTSVWEKQKRWNEMCIQLEKSIQHQQQAVKARPREHQYRDSLANHYIKLASTLWKLQKPEEALRAYSQAMNNRQKLVEDFPAIIVYRENLGNSRIGYGVILNSLRQYQEAETNYLDAIEQYHELTTKFPSNSDYKYKIATAQYNLGNLQKKGLHQLKNAETSYRQAVKCLHELTSTFPNKAEYKATYGAALHNLSTILTRRGEWTEAIQFLEKAIENQKSAFNAQIPYAHEHIVNHYASLAAILTKCHDQKLRNPIRAKELALKALEIDPQHSASHIVLGLAHFRQGDWNATIVSINNGLDLIDKKKETQKSSVRDNEEQEAKCIAKLFLAMSYWHLGQIAEARKWYDQAENWLDNNKTDDEGLPRIRAEAAELMKSKEADAKPK